jgi:hypothetical protein
MGRKAPVAGVFVIVGHIALPLQTAYVKGKIS